MCFPHNELSDLESISYITLIQAKSFTTHAANKRFLDRCSRTIKKHILGNIMTKGEGGGVVVNPLSNYSFLDHSELEVNM